MAFDDDDFGDDEVGPDIVVGKGDFCRGSGGKSVAPRRGKQRRWPEDVKARIVAETYERDVSVSAVARRHELCSSQLYRWRQLAREGELVMAGNVFVPAVIEGPASLPEERLVDRIEVEVAGVLVRLPHDVTALRIGEIASALRGSG